MKYAECTNCGKLHYVVSAEKAQALSKSEVLVEEFSERKVTNCSNCGSKNCFHIVPEDYVDKFSSGNKLLPILMENENSKQTTIA